jgi:bifunctional enzyme CysN/CysC
MAPESALIASDIDAYLEAHRRKSLLRFITCGSVDDGKSTLIGRLLYDSKMIFEDQFAALEEDSKRVGTRGGEVDFALLVDGLAAEREQGITIDVAYRFFSTERRKFIVADTPGHEQYTRNMVTGASTADLAVILIDARKGVLTQTRRHSYLVALLGIRRVVLAINKMDLVDYSQASFERIVADYREFAAHIGLAEIVAIPLSAVHGDNILERGPNLAWYRGATLLGALEGAEIATAVSTRPLRFLVQWVNRPNLDFRGFCGQVLGGRVRPGDAVRVLPSGRTSRIARILLAGSELKEAVSGQSVTLTLEDEVDVSRGDVIAAAELPPPTTARIQATLVWMNEAPLFSGRSYLLKTGATTVNAVVAPIRHKIDINTLEALPAERLDLNDIGVAELALDRPVVFEPYSASRSLGGFILIDRLSNETVGAGLIDSGLARGDHVQWQALDVDKAARAAAKGQRPAVLWMTGLSGAGKSTIANLVEAKLAAEGRHTYLLDGDNLRHGLNADLGFTERDRIENIRRVAEVARLMLDAGLIVIVAFISPFRAERDAARARLEPGEFIEIFIDTPLEEAERRDVKGLYAKARRGEIANFTGIDSPYEAPRSPEIHILTARTEAAAAAEQIVDYLHRAGYVGRT